jgi:GNAT superfamily N-acetyltransferase
MANYRLVIDDSPTAEDVITVRRGLVDYNVATARIDEQQSLAVFIRDEHDHVVGGITGEVWGKVLEIRYMWLHEDVRGQSFGHHALIAIEQEAVKRGCTTAILDTYSFQAPDFYRKHGYQVFAVVEGYADRHQKYFMQKVLTSNVVRT